MSTIQSFSFLGQEVRAKDIQNQTWWVLKDVCNALEIQNSTDILNRLDDDEKGVDKIYTLGGLQEVSIINESGLYALILRSNKPNAKPFRKWVTSEVLPQIRKTGGYGVAKPDDIIIKDRYIALLEKHNDLLIDLTLYKEQLQKSKTFRPVNQAEQMQIKAMYEQGFQTGEIARELNRDKSTIRRHKNMLALGGAVNHG